MMFIKQRRCPHWEGMIIALLFSFSTGCRTSQNPAESGASQTEITYGHISGTVSDGVSSDSSAADGQSGGTTHQTNGPAPSGGIPGTNGDPSTGTAPSGGGSQSNESANRFFVPVFPKNAANLKNTDYRIQIREQGGSWQEIEAYKVRINNNPDQNITAADPVKESPMIYFQMGDRPVEVTIQWNKGRIASAKVHPESSKIPATVGDGVIAVTLNAPRNICVQVNNDRYEMVYIFANTADPAMPAGSGGTVRVIEPGVTNCPKVGTGSWAGGIRDVRLYNRVLTAAEREALQTGGTVEGYSHRWAFQNGTADEGGSGSSKLGSPTIKYGYQGSSGALIFNGYEDALSTSALWDMSGSFTISAWAYLEPGRDGVQRNLLNYLLFVRSDGKVGSNIGDWQFPYVSQNTFAAGNWHHVVLTKLGDDVTVYIDGVSGGTQHRPVQTGGVYVTIGSGDIVNGIHVKAGETLYLKPGAVLRGTVLIYGSKNAAVKGSGVIDVVQSGSVSSYSGIVCAYSRDIQVEGVIVNNPSSFNLALGQSRNVTVSNFKCFSSYGASDGINTKACENVTVDGCFVRSNDDAVSIYATSVGYLGSTRGYVLKNTTLINDTAHAVNMGIHGQEFGTDEVTGVRVENIDVVDSKCSYPDYQGVLSLNAGNDVKVHDIAFSNVRIEDIRVNQLFNLRVCYNPGYNKSPGRSVENIRFSDITYTGTGAVASVLQGYDTTRIVQDILFENVVMNGTKLRPGDGGLIIVKHVDSVTIR